jgi:hypothetical protein
MVVDKCITRLGEWQAAESGHCIVCADGAALDIGQQLAQGFLKHPVMLPPRALTLLM